MPQTVYIKSGFTMVPNVVLFHPTLSAKAVRLFEVLEHHSGEHRVCWPSYPTLADEVGCSRRWLPELINELEKAGLIHAFYREGKTYLFTLLLRVERQPKPTHAVASPQPMNPIRYEQKQPTKTNEKRAISPVIQIPEPTIEEKFAKTAAYIRGESVRWSRDRN